MAPVYKEPPLQPGESYPESRFGMPPMKVDIGINSGYASRAVEEMETVDEGSGTVRNRRLANAPQEALVQGRSASDTAEGSGVPGVKESVALSQASAAARKGVQEVALIAGDLGFFPKTVFVSRDVPVRMFVTGASKNTLCIMMDSFQIRKQVRSQKIEEITFTPSNPGKYRFYCPVNGMEGTMIVKDLAMSIPAEP